MRVFSAEKGFGIIDTLITLLLIAVLIGVLLPRYEKTAVEARKAALQMGLQNIRLAIGVYRMVNHRYPNDLKELIHRQYIFAVKEDTVFASQYLQALSVDADGQPLDPFGNRYRYDRSRGWVSSTTEGYESW